MVAHEPEVGPDEVLDPGQAGVVGQELLEPVDGPVACDMPKLALDINGTAAAMCLSDRTVRRLVKRGLLHPVAATRRLIFHIEEINRFLRESTGKV